MIYEVGLALFLSGRPSSVANHSQNTRHFLRTGGRPDVVLLPALLSPLLIYLIDYESNPCIIPWICSCAFTARRLKTISCVFDLLAPSLGADFELKNLDYLPRSDLVKLLRCRRSNRRAAKISQITILRPPSATLSRLCYAPNKRI